MSTIEEIRAARLEKLKLLKEKGIAAYPISTDVDCDLKTLEKNFLKLSKKKKLTIAGRIMALRPQGGLVFFNLDDGTAKFQGLVRKDEIGEDVFNIFSATVDIGDFIEATGELFVTKRKERTLLVKSWRMLSKSLRPLPEKWHGLQDTEERFRKRYLDLIASPGVKARFILRSKILSEIRKFLEAEGFVEVETSILQPQAGGASAEPFRTHENALNTDLYLRIAKELDLKKLLIGGLPKIFELGRDFRNEGIDLTHNPEFTMVEWYEAYSDSSKQRLFVQRFIQSLVKTIHGVSIFEFDGNQIETKNVFTAISYYDLLKRFALLENPEKSSRESLALSAAQLGVKVENAASREKILDSIYKKTCRPKLIQPTFITDYPVNMLPLAKKKEGRDDLVDAFQLIIGGTEIVKAFSELNDPIDQAERFGYQEKEREAGDKEAQPTDKLFLEALEYGMPPAAGVGIGIDRLVMLLTNQKNIREVIIFPTMRPKN
jgi:lysyl-tRNA synthetase class 2